MQPAENGTHPFGEHKLHGVGLLGLAPAKSGCQRRRRLFKSFFCRSLAGYLALPITPSTYQSKLPILSPPQDSPAGILVAPVLSTTGPVNGLNPFSTLSAAAVTMARTSAGTSAPNGATAIIEPRPCLTIAGLNVPAITLLAVSVMNGPQVKPKPVSQPLGASAMASIDWKPIEYAPRLSATWITVAGESTCMVT